MTRILPLFAVILLLCSLPGPVQADDHTVARLWNETLLDGIRNDFARPTVHARNLFHSSVLMYDAWAVYDDVASTYFLGKTVDGFTVPFFGIPDPPDGDIRAAQEEAMSYAMFRLIHHRFVNAPGVAVIMEETDALMNSLGYDPLYTSTDYSNGDPAALGNYLAEQMIAFGLQDGANEQGLTPDGDNDKPYGNLYYEPVNDPLVMLWPGNPDITDMNRWQPLTLDVFIDQSGNEIPIKTPAFLSPEWGIVSPFALQREDATIYKRDGFDYYVYHDPGPPPYMAEDGSGVGSAEYRWGHELVAVWSSHLDPNDGVMWDISPAGIGNIGPLPESIEDYRDFYDLQGGGDTSQGWDLNPVTGEPYEPQIVPRGDYARVLAEFWADGPDSETPPGHWFTIINYVNEHPDLVKKFKGEGEILDDLEWDVKSYFVLGGAMHDVAVAVWGIKGYYDYVRPVSAIRAMGDRGQSTDPQGPEYNPQGMTLIDDICELVEPGDPLAGDENEHVGKVKLHAWRGPDYVEDPDVDDAGVGWILAENWWPYQRPSFVTPPFAGYVSGHSTFSRTAAVVLSLFTGDEFFPGGMGEFHAPLNEFLVFEDGPSVDMTLQWATYRDASDQCSLSRIWGGIHPPADDIPGRKIGEVMGAEIFEFAEAYFRGERGVDPTTRPSLFLAPNPVATNQNLAIQFGAPTSRATVSLYDVQGRMVLERSFPNVSQNQLGVQLGASDIGDVSSGMYYVRVVGDSWQSSRSVVILN